MIDGISVEMEGSMEGRNVKPGGGGCLVDPAIWVVGVEGFPSCFVLFGGDL